MTLIDALRADAQRKTIHAQTKLTATESAQVDAAVDELNRAGITTTRSGLIRALILNGLRNGVWK